MTCKTTAYDTVSLRLNNIGSAARLLMDLSPGDDTTQGHDKRDFLLLTILDGIKEADKALEVLSPYKD